MRDNTIPIQSATNRQRNPPETVSLYIDLSGRPSSESKEISEGIVLDYDLNGRLVGIDIDNDSDKVELKKLILNKLPGTVETVNINVEKGLDAIA